MLPSQTFENFVIRVFLSKESNGKFRRRELVVLFFSLNFLSDWPGLLFDEFLDVLWVLMSIELVWDTIDE